MLAFYIPVSSSTTCWWFEVSMGLLKSESPGTKPVRLALLLRSQCLQARPTVGHCNHTGWMYGRYIGIRIARGEVNAPSPTISVKG